MNTALDDARRALAVRSQALDDAQRARTEADQRASALPDPVPLRQARDAFDAVEELRPQAEHVAADLAAAVERLQSADASADTSAAEVTAAQEALAATSVAHAAHALAVNLVAGEPCPVCAQVVTAPTKPAKPAALSTREKALKSAETAAKRARDAATKARAAHAQLASEAQQLAGRLDAHRAALEANPDIDVITAQLAEIDAATKAAIDGRTNEEAARAAVKQAEGAARGVEARDSEARRTLQSRREEFLREGLDPPDPDDDLAAAWAGFAAWAAQTEASQRAGRHLGPNRGRRGTRPPRDASRWHSRERASNLDVAAADDLGALRDSVVEAGTNAKHALERIEESIERATKLRERVDAARSEYDVADMLATHMRADRFERWVLVEAIELLVDAASQTLAALSAGHYSLRYSDEEFVVVDHRNADAERSVRTLSGGETFQASLALALALSDQLTTLSAGSRGEARSHLPRRGVRHARRRHARDRRGDDRNAGLDGSDGRRRHARARAGGARSGALPRHPYRTLRLGHSGGRVRFTVDPWDPAYGSSLESDLQQSEATVVADLEVRGRSVGAAAATGRDDRAGRGRVHRRSTPAGGARVDRDRAG